MSLQHRVGILSWVTLLATVALAGRIADRLLPALADSATPGILAAMLSAVPHVLLTVSLLSVALFCHYWQRDDGAPASTALLDRAGVLMLAAAAASPVARLAASFVLHPDAGLRLWVADALAGPALLAVAIGFLFGMLTRLAAALVAQAAELRRENEAFV